MFILQHPVPQKNERELTPQEKKYSRLQGIKSAFKEKCIHSILSYLSRRYDAGRISLENIRGVIQLADYNSVTSVNFKDANNAILPTEIETLKELEIGLLLLSEKLYQMKWIAESDVSKDTSIFDEEFVYVDNVIKAIPKTVNLGEILEVADETEI